jgi:hypothetical protein
MTNSALNRVIGWGLLILALMAAFLVAAHYLTPATAAHGTALYDTVQPTISDVAEIPSDASTAEAAMADSNAAEQLDAQHADAQAVGAKARPLIQGVTDVTGFITGTATAVWNSVERAVR